MSAPPLLRGRLLEVTRGVYLQRGGGTVVAGRVHLPFRDGELHLDRDVAEVAGLRERVAAAGARAAADPELRRAVETIAARLGAADSVELRDERPPADAVGPLPAVWLVLALAGQDAAEEDLLARLGGLEASLAARTDGPALAQLPGLDEEMSRVLPALEEGGTVGAMLRAAGSRRRAFLRGLVKLWAIGLAETRTATAELLGPRLLEQFLGRIARTFATEPLELPAAEHRRRLSELFTRSSELDHYGLLGVEPGAGELDVLAGYHRVARLAHPSHQERLGLGGRDEMLRVVFERATEAYLVLSDPIRRLAYNEFLGTAPKVAVDAAKRQQEKRDLAKRLYRRATSAVSEMDFSVAAELLGEASRLDPQPEYWALLGNVQARNPRWLDQAVSSFERSLELRPGDAGVHFACGQVLERLERRTEARRHYEATLKAAPDHPDARSGLERLR